MSSKPYVGCFISRMLNCMRTSYNELQRIIRFNGHNFDDLDIVENILLNIFRKAFKLIGALCMQQIYQALLSDILYIILLLGKIEQWEAINDKEFQTTNEGESFDYFSKEGEKYLSMAHNLREKNSKLFPRVLKALDNFTRLNAFAKSTNLQDVASLYRYEYFLEKLFAWKAAEDKRKYKRYCKSCGGCECCGRTEHEEIVENKNEYKIMNDEKERDEEIRQNKNKYNKRIAENKNKYVNGILLEREYDTVMEYEDIVFMFREAEEKSAYGYDYAYSFLKDYCVMFMFFRQLENFRMLVAMIQDLYVEYKKYCLLLHNLMANYCLKANSFLRAQLRSSRKLRRSKEHSMRCKYRYLKQLIARIIEERNDMARYIGTASDRRSEANAK